MMKKVQIGDRVEIPGNTQDYILIDPNKVYRGEVVEKDDGDLLVRLDKPVVRGPGEFKEVTVRESNVRLSNPGKN
ncbi:MAG TPA: hypothetical protein VN937_23685 [Blastocatellia bacterium]|nr:hypothetical protein [Blastocatellia bacterium]